MMVKLLSSFLVSAFWLLVVNGGSVFVAPAYGAVKAPEEQGTRAVNSANEAMAEAVFNAAPKDVLLWLTNVALLPAWMPFCEKAEFVRFAPPLAELTMVMPSLYGAGGMALRWAQRLELTDSEGYRIISKTVSGLGGLPLTMETEWRLEAVGGQRTRVMVSIAVKTAGGSGLPVGLLDGLPRRTLAGLEVQVKRGKPVVTERYQKDLLRYLASVGR